MHWTGIKPSWARKDFVKYFFISLVYPRQNHDRSSQVYGSQGNCPCLTSGRTAKDSVAQTQIHRGQDDLGFARSWGILERFGHSLYYWEKLFSQQPRTEGFHLCWCPWSWRNCNTGAMMRAKPHIPEMRQNQSGDEYQADDQVAGRPTISPLPLLQGGALLFALLILLALEICIWWPSVAVIVSR